MQLKPEFRVRYVPHPAIEHLPQMERPAADHVRRLLRLQTSFYEHFAEAVALFEYCRSEWSGYQPLPNAWAFIASRDAGMSIWHFGETLLALRSGFKDCATFRASVNFEAVREAWRSYGKCFPFAEQMRHAIAHAANLDKTVADREANALKSPVEVAGTGVTIDGRLGEGLIGDRFMTNINGQLVEFAMSWDTTRSLLEILHQTFSAFPPPATPDPALE
ncbi:MAG TPA: hypothetical protein VEZ41_04135 [Allosphingosinicella sp.]|nr:hypothetical protein [Allosphingosinicella sp.]